MSTIRLTVADFGGGTPPALASNTTYILDESVTITSAFTSVGSNVVFDGNLNTITVSGVTGFVGLFPSALTVQNLGVLSSGSTLANNAGWFFQASVSGILTAINCYSTGDIGVSGGGIFGYNTATGNNNSLTAINCYSRGNIGNSGGGIVGSQCTVSGTNVTVNITNCYSTGSFESAGGAGGIIGSICGSTSNKIIIQNCYSKGNIGIGGGGICGQSCTNITAIRCYSNGTINSQAGGIFGIYTNISYAKSCYSTGSNSGGGGIFGYNCGFSITGTCTADSCYSTGNMSSGGGGIFLSPATSNTLIALNCYSTGTIGSSCGGIFGPGTTENVIINAINCYATGSQQNIRSGGICATIDTSTPIVNITNCYVVGTRLVGLYSNTSPTITNSIRSNTWDDATAQTTLSSSPTVWYSWTPNTPYRLSPLSRNAIASNGSLWVTVGNGPNTISTSTDAITWTGLGNTVFTDEGKAVAWNGSLWVAVGKGTTAIAYSQDGKTWTAVVNPPFASGLGISWSGTQWVATGEFGASTATSVDGITWTATGATVLASGNAVQWNNSNKGALTLQPLIVGTINRGSNNLVYSTDGGYNWTFMPNQTVFTTSANKVVYNGKLWVAVGDGTNRIAYSYDGLNWIGLGSAVLAGNGIGLGWNGTMWLAIASIGAIENCIAYSYNGINWIGVNAPSVYMGGIVLWNNRNKVWIIANDNTFYSSPNGITWSVLNPSPITAIVDLAFNGYIYVSVTGSRNTNRILYSYDGITWTNAPNVGTVSAFLTDASNVVWNGTIWVVGGFRSSGSRIGYSYDGIYWYKGNISTNISKINFIKWIGNKWIVSGISNNDNIILHSGDGINWSIIRTILNISSGVIVSSIDYASETTFSPKQTLLLTSPSYSDGALTSGATASINLYKPYKP